MKKQQKLSPVIMLAATTLIPVTSILQATKKIETITSTPLVTAATTQNTTNARVVRIAMITLISTTKHSSETAPLITLVNEEITKTIKPAASVNKHNIKKQKQHFLQQ